MSPEETPFPPPPELERVKRTRRATLERMEGLSQGALDRSPRQGVWSAGEVLDHLVLSDALYSTDIRRLFEMAAAGEEPVLRRSFAELNPSIFFFPKALLPIAELPLAFFNLFLPRGARDALVRSRWVPAQNPDATAPRPGRPAAELRAELEAFPAQLSALFADHPQLDSRRLRHYHPLLGHNTVPQLLSFIANHENRHQEQIDDILRRTGAATERG